MLNMFAIIAHARQKWVAQMPKNTAAYLVAGAGQLQSDLFPWTKNYTTPICI